MKLQISGEDLHLLQSARSNNITATSQSFYSLQHFWIFKLVKKKIFYLFSVKEELTYYNNETFYVLCMYLDSNLYFLITTKQLGEGGVMYNMYI